MTYKQKIGFSGFLLAALVLVAVAFVYLKVKGVNASENNAPGKVTWQTKLVEDVNGDSKLETILLTSYDDGLNKRSTISTKQSLFGSRTAYLKGFEEDLAFCPKKYFKDADGRIDICVFGEVGVHSQNIEVLRWSDFSPIKFIASSGEASDNITSDEPNFDFDYNSDPKIQIYLDNRNYDLDPLVDIIRSHYYLGSNAFYQQSTEKIQNEGLIK